MGTDFYHYTSRESKDKIKSSRKITQSTKPGLLHGPGVYLTTLPPEEGRRGIARNNYDSTVLWEDMEDEGRIDCVFQVKLDMSQVEKVPEEKAGRRDIYVFRGNLDLNEVNWSVKDLV